MATAKAQKFEAGKVSVAELQENEHPKDPSAVAAVLFEKGQDHLEYNQSTGFELITTVTVRVKIYKKEGYQWANKTVKYFIGGSSKEKISFDDVATYNLVDGKIEKTKMKGDGLFEEKVNKYWASKKIALPNVKEGSVIEYTYKIISPNFMRFPDWAFQTTIPVNFSEYKTFIPEYFVYSPNQRGFIFPKVATEKSTKSINFTIKDRGLGVAVKTSISYEKVDYEETRTTYTAENLPAMVDEAYVNNIKNYTSAVSHELSMTKFPNVPLKSYSTNWEAVVKEIYKLDDFGSELDKSGYFEQAVIALTKGLTDRESIIAAIFNHVKMNVKWNDYYGYSCDEGVNAAYKNRTGNVAEINLMLTAMLRFAGLDANPILISTRSNGISYFPNRTAFNYVIAGVETMEGLILLDATDKFSRPDVLPLRDLNWFGRLIRKDGTSLQVNLTPKNISKEISYMNVVLKNDGSAEGKIRKQFTDYEALAYREKAVGSNMDSFVEELENDNNSIQISEYVRDNDLELSKPLVESFSFRDSKNIEVIDNKMYLSPLLFLADRENPFKQEKREYPIDFGYPSEMKYNINIEIPQGYTVESLPKSINLLTGDEIGSFKYAIGNTDNKIQLSITSNINAAIVPADYYDVLKDFYQKVIEKQNEKIVLRKS